MDLYLTIKTMHILSATILFGTGLGTAFFMAASHFSDNLQAKLYAARTTVLADYLFTTPAIIIQPMTGIWLISEGGFDPMAPWLVTSYALYSIAGLCWIPVVLIQIQFKRMLIAALTTQSPLPEKYARLFKIWFVLGWPAFIALITIFYLMVAKPS
jgi:uncharacterized membrane protein